MSTKDIYMNGKKMGTVYSPQNPIPHDQTSELELGQYIKDKWFCPHGLTLCDQCKNDIELIVRACNRHAQALITRARVEAELKGQIKYLTMKARWQRVFLDGDEDALITKRYVRTLKRRLAALKKGTE